MAIAIKLHATEANLFCSSKWWGNPDLPPGAAYPMMKIKEDGREEEYPLTFICQIDCEDIAPLDPEGKLPHEGMLYFFAAIDDFTGYESPEHFPLGRWPAKAIKVKYTGSINMETFNSCILVDDEDNELAEEPLAMEFSSCDDAADGIKLLGTPFFEEVSGELPDCANLLQIDSEDEAGLNFYDCGMLNILLKDSELGFGRWDRAFGFLHSL